MPLHLPHPHMNVRVLAVFALVSLPLLAVGAMVVLGGGQSQLRTTYGHQLSQVAEQTAATLDTYMYRRVIDVSRMGRIPTLREAAARASAAPFDANRMQALDYEWRSNGVPDELQDTVDGPTAAYLRDIVARDSAYREILLADRHGRLVASSDVSSDYDQSDEDWWQTAFGDGRSGRVDLADVRWDDSARTYAIDISVPVPMPGRDGELAGVLKVVADSREMLAFVDSARPGTTGEAAVVRPDGSVVFSRRPYAPDARYFAATLLSQRLQQSGWGDPTLQVAFAAVDGNGQPQLISVAPSQLGASYPNLAWVVAVSQSEAELFGPVHTQMFYMLLVIAVTTVVMLLLALWFSMRLAAPPVGIDMHLVDHPKVARIAEDELTT